MSTATPIRTAASASVTQRANPCTDSIALFSASICWSAESAGISVSQLSNIHSLLHIAKKKNAPGKGRVKRQAKNFAFPFKHYLVGFNGMISAFYGTHSDILL
jgi:hypothetical protein